MVALMLSQPGMIERLLAEHTDDGSGRCRKCSSGGQTGHYRWPCAICYYALQARQQEADDPAPGSGSA